MKWVELWKVTEMQHHTLGIKIKGHHGHYLKPSEHDNGAYFMEKIKDGVVAFKSSAGKYLSGTHVQF